MAKVDEFRAAVRRAAERRSKEPFAVAARYDRRRDPIIVSLDTGIEIAFPPGMAQGLQGAAPAALANIELSPSGFGIHFPRLDAHLYVPALLQGVLGSKSWMAAQLGARGGRVTQPGESRRSRDKRKTRRAAETGQMAFATPDNNAIIPHNEIHAHNS